MTRIRGLVLSLAVLLAISTNYSPTPARADDAAEAGDRASTGDLKPMVEGPLHEAFLSPRRDVEPPLVPKPPPPPVIERPAMEPPGSDARWIAGYWEWSPERSKFNWVTGTWRVPPPGRFWVNGFWKREEAGWRRIPGFWSDRATDRIAFRKDGPPNDPPDDDPGPPPKADCFYIPGQYVVDGDGISWRKGFWADSKVGWSWVPASWSRQPEGWIFQEGYWDRPLEERGVLFAPAEMAREPRDGEVLAYRPYTIVSPELYGQLYGAFGRSTPDYDGYPGVCYDAGGRFYGYASYGTLSPYLGYLDYPAVASYGSPYFAAPLSYGYTPAFNSGFRPLGPLAYGLGFPYFGYGGSLLPLMTGYPVFGNLGLVGSGWGWGYPGWGTAGVGWGSTGWSGMALGTWPGFNWGSWGWSGPAIGAFPAFGVNLGFPNWTSGWGGFGWGNPGLGQFGWGWPSWGWGSPGLFWGNNFPLWTGFLPFQNSGHNHQVAATDNNRHVSMPMTPGGTGANRPVPDGIVRRGPMDLTTRGLGGLRSVGVNPPPSSRPFAALGDGSTRTTLERGPRQEFAGANRRASAAERSATWNHAFNGVPPAAMQRHQVARPAFTNAAGPAGDGGTVGRLRQSEAGGPSSAGFNPQMRGLDAPLVGDRLRPNIQQNDDGNRVRPGGMRGGPAPNAAQASAGGLEFAPQIHRAPALNNIGASGGMRASQPMQRPGNDREGQGPRDFGIAGPGRIARPGTDALGSEFSGGMRQPRGLVNGGGFGAGAFNNGGLNAGAFSGGMRVDDGIGGGRGGFGPVGGLGPVRGGFGGVRGAGIGGGGGLPGGGAIGGGGFPGGGMSHPSGGGLGGPGGGGFGGHAGGVGGSGGGGIGGHSGGMGGPGAGGMGGRAGGGHR